MNPFSISKYLTLLVDRGEAAAAWVQERSERPETETPELTALRIPVHEMYAKPRATQRLLDDAFINVESWLSEKIAQQMGHIESKAFVHGDGEGKPKGFLAYPRQVGDAPWGQLEEVTTGVVGAFAAEDPEAALLDVFHRLKPADGEGASWVMSRTASSGSRVSMYSPVKQAEMSSWRREARVVLLVEGVVGGCLVWLLGCCRDISWGPSGSGTGGQR